MPSTYSPSLKLELIGNGEQAANWGNTTNYNLGSLLEQAITGVGSITMPDANYTLVSGLGVVDEARNAVLVLGGTLTASRNLVVPTANKFYAIRNATSGGYAVVVKTAAGSGVTLANGYTQLMYCDGTNVVAATQSFDAVNGNVVVTGNVLISKNTPQLTLSKTASGQNNLITGSTNGSARWNILAGDATSESGSNVGSDFAISRYDDSGSYISTTLTINRASGQTSLSSLLVNAGDITVNKNTPQLFLNKTASGQNNLITGSTNGSTRWVILPGDGTAESGSNAGSNLGVNRYDDSGSYIDTPFSIVRSTGETRTKTLTASGDITTYRSSAPAQGAVYFGNAGKYLYWNGSNFEFSNALNVAGYVSAGSGYVNLPEATGGVNVRYVHNNSGTIGFLNSSAAWALRVDDSGNTTAAGSVITGGGSGGYLLSGVGSYNYSSTNDTVQLAGNGNASVFSKNTTANVNQIVFNNGNGQVGFINTDGSSTSYGTSSDYRLKSDVRPMTNALSIISALKPSSYKWKVSNANGDGFIAHELQEVIPHAVGGIKDAVNEDGSIKPQGVDYSKIVVYLVAAMQEQQKQINDLTAKVEALEKKVAGT